METCAECGKPIMMDQPSYYRKDPAGDFGKTFHSGCGDPLGIKAKDTEIERLRAALQLIDDYYQTGGNLMSHVAHIAQDALAVVCKEKAPMRDDTPTKAELVDEIERLRAAIKAAADKIDSPTRCPRVEIVRELRAILEE